MQLNKYYSMNFTEKGINISQTMEDDMILIDMLIDKRNNVKDDELKQNIQKVIDLLLQ